MQKSNTTITPPHKNKALGLTASLLALSSVLGSASIASAATFNFSFDNTDTVAPFVNGTVQGTVTIPNTALTVDGTYTASSVVITSAPPALGYSTPLETIGGAFGFNIITVASGVVTAIKYAVNDFAGVGSSLGIFKNTDVTGSRLSNVTDGATGASTDGVYDSADTTLIISPLAASTPEPTSIITLIGVGVLGVASKLKKKA